MTLREILRNIDFDYEVVCGNAIKLIDNTGANLGLIENERYDISDQITSVLMDRLEMYWSDYFYDEEWVKTYGYDRNDSYEELLDKTPVSEPELIKLLEHLINPERIVVEI